MDIIAKRGQTFRVLREEGGNSLWGPTERWVEFSVVKIHRPTEGGGCPSLDGVAQD